MGLSTKEVTDILRFLATGLVEWEDTPPDKRIQTPQPLRLGMSRMNSSANLFGISAPLTLPELVEWAANTKLRSDIVAGLLGSSHFSWIEDNFLERNLV